MSLKRKTKFLIAGASLVVAVGVLFLLNSKFRFLADALGPPYVIFQAENYAQVDWNTKPQRAQILREDATISTFAAKGQIEDVSFSVRPNVNLGEVQLELSALKMGDLTIPKENIEILNLKVWEQCSGVRVNGVIKDSHWIYHCQDGSNISERRFVPELLVEDNQQNLADAEPGVDWQPGTGTPTSALYKAPQVNRKFRAVLGLDKKGKSKTHTFYLRIKVPEDAAPGNYSAELTFKPTGQISQKLNLAVAVMPFSLSAPAKEVLTRTTQRELDKSFQLGRGDIGVENYAKYLDFLKESGFTSLMVYQQDPAGIPRILSLMKERGFKGTFVLYTNPTYLNNIDGQYSAILKSVVDTIKAEKDAEGKPIFDVYLYGNDEPNSQGKLSINTLWANSTHQAGAKTTTSILKQTLDLNNLNDNLLFPNLWGLPRQEKIDLGIYPLIPSSKENDNIAKKVDYSWYLSVNKQKPFFSPWIGGEQTFFNDDDPAAPKVDVPKGEWVLVTSVWNATTKKFETYLRGEKDGSKTLTSMTATKSGKIPKNFNNALIGAFNKDKNSKTNLGLKGELDSVRVYNTALTADQIKADYDSGPSARSTSPTAEYNFEEGSGSVTADATNNNGACQIVGAAWKNRDETNTKTLVFDGSSYLDCPSLDNYKIEDSMSVEAWVKLDDTASETTHNMIISKVLPSAHETGLRLEDYLQGLRDGTVAKNPQKEFGYIQIWPEFVNLISKRVLGGFFLWNSGLDGILPFGLDTALNSSGDKIFNDKGQGRTIKAGDGGKSEWAIYPAADGKPIPTIQFESFRAGIDDLRYISTYDEYSQKLMKLDVAKAKEIDDQVKSRLNLYYYDYSKDAQGNLVYNDKTQEQPMYDPAKYPNSYHQETRKFVADKIMEIIGHLKIVVSTYNFAPGLNIVGTNQPINSRQITDHAGLVLQSYDPKSQAWIASPSGNITLEPGKAYYVTNNSGMKQTVPIYAEITAAGATNPRLYLGGNFLYNNIQRDQRLTQIKVDIYGGTTCLAKDVTLQSLKDSGYIVKRPYIVGSLDKIVQPTLSEASNSPGSVTSIPSKKGYWIFVKNNISGIVADSEFANNRCD